MSKFFKDILLEESAVYTLWGSKPLTIIPLYHYSEEEEKMYREHLSEEERKSLFEIEDYDIPEKWEKWEKIQSRFPIHRYLFFKKPDPNHPKVYSIYFVDIFRTALVLQENYSCFSRETGVNFDPLQAVFEIKEGSEFWDKVMNHSALMGLLYGFGMQNSYGFRWRYGSDPLKSEKFAKSLNYRFSDTPKFGLATLENFSLPIFASFAENHDEVIQKYKKEREEIKQAYLDKDFLDLTLERLSENTH
ncbi:MAG: hypothetical protein ACM3JI_00565 [Anaerolineae bacterium]